MKILTQKALCVLITISVLFAFSGCGFAFANAYKYADSFQVKDVEWIYPADLVLPDETPASNSERSRLNACKGLVNGNVPYRELYDWGTFNELDITAVTDYGQMKNGYEKAIKNLIAFYDPDSTTVYLMPKFSAIESSLDENHIVVHEIIHSLVGDCSDSSRELNEGLVEWLAVEVFHNSSYSSVTYGQNYTLETACVRTLIDIYGEQTTVHALTTDNLASLLDRSTKSGMSEKLNYALYILHYSSDAERQKTAANVVVDILAHTAKIEGQDFSSWLDYFTDFFAANNIEIDEDYFKKL